MRRVIGFAARHARLLSMIAVACVLLWLVLAQNGSDGEPAASQERARPQRPGASAAITKNDVALAAPLASPGDAAPQRVRAWPGSAEVKADPFLPLGFAPSAAKSSAPTPAATAAAAVKQAVAAPAPPTPSPRPAANAAPAGLQAIGSIAGADVAGGAPVAFVMQQDQMLVVKVGDKIANSYRVDAISAQGVEVTYLPSMQKQSLRFQP